MSRVVVGSLAALMGAAPALPCSQALPPGIDHFVVVDNDAVVPTNVALVTLEEEMGPWSAIVRRDDGVDEGEVFAFDGAVGVDGALDLAPNTAFVVDVPTTPVLPGTSTFRFSTGEGPDDDAPPAPDVAVERIDHSAHIIGPDSCRDAPELDVGFTMVLLTLSGDDAASFHVVATGPDGVVEERFVGGDSTLFREFDGGVWSVAVSAIDVAGNVGDATVVEADFGGCGGCASSSSSPSSALLLFTLASALAGIRRRRG